jgi:hypothetical protein
MTMNLKPWREIIIPHEDVLEGNVQEAAFAADLTKVVLGKALPEYQNPALFFERTVITEGMSLLLQSVVKRLGGKGGDPVVQLQTAFGGGKTHTMLAVLHVAGGKVPAKKMLGVSEILEKAGVKELVRGRVAVLDGNAMGPSQPRTHGKIKVNTLWGELAMQLGGEEGYEMVAASDREGTSPGKGILAELFTRFSPAIVLIDEAVAYIRQFEGGRTYKGGTYNSNISFLQALTEAASGVPTAMVLASLPESTMEVGDQFGQSTLDAVQKIFGRIEAVWKPVGTDEAFEIVRRRLFGPVQDAAARDAVCHAFVELYAKEADKFPLEAREGSYLRRLTASYPIHPEVFDRLYKDWSTLPKFQRTRGVLRLMSQLIHSLWRGDNRDLLILPGSIPLDDVSVRNELVKYLPAGWDAIVDKDIDGPQAEPRHIDDSTPALGSMQACRRAARAIFLGSAPSVAGQQVRGFGIERVRLGCAQPGQSVLKYDDALRRLSDRLHYLYSGNDRYWFDLRPNLRREMEDRMHRFDPSELHENLESRLKTQVKPGIFAAVHVFAAAKDIPDRPELRLVVLGPDHTHKRKDHSSKAIAATTEILESHGDKLREFKNCLLFLVPDGSATMALRDHLRRFLAWRSIVEEADQLNLDPHHQREAKKSRDEANERVNASIREVYRLLLVPMEDPEEPNGPSTVLWEDEGLSLAGSTFDKEIEKAVHAKEWVIQKWAEDHLNPILVRWFWKPDQPTVLAKEVWLKTCRYLYLPRLKNAEVFTQTVREGITHEDFFGYASGEKNGKLEGLLFGASGAVPLSDTALLIHPDAARAARDKALEKEQGATGGEGGWHGKSGTTGKSEPPPSSSRPGKGKGVAGPKPEVRPRRFHGTIDLDVSDPIGNFAKIVDDVIEHLTKYGTDVALTLEIEARRGEGFETNTVRIVRENANSMKFKISDFEED